MRNPNVMGTWLHLLIYSRRTYGNRPSKLLPRHCPTRHILCRSPLPLRSLYGGCICDRCGLCSLIPTFYRLHSTRHMNQNPFWCNICRGQFNLLPSTFPRTCRNASTILRLPRRIHPVKYSFLNRIPGLFSRSNHVPLHYLRSICCKT